VVAERPPVTPKATGRTSMLVCVPQPDGPGELRRLLIGVIVEVHRSFQ
jgi:hypothetical protein